MVQKWGKLPPHLEDDDVQGFPSEELSKFKILDIMYVMWLVLKTLTEHMTSSKVMM